MTRHPNDVPGVPMRFPPWLERFQIKYINPAVTPIARYLPTIGVIRHTGRKSGVHYETPVSPYRKGDVVAVGLLHGQTNWVKNVLAAGEAEMRVGRDEVRVVNPRVIPAGGDTTGLPLAARVVGRRNGVFVADIA